MQKLCNWCESDLASNTSVMTEHQLARLAVEFAQLLIAHEKAERQSD